VVRRLCIIRSQTLNEPVANTVLLGSCIRSVTASLLIGFISFGCSPDSLHETTGSSVRVNHRPVIRSVTITPSPLVLNGPVSATVDAEDRDGNSLTIHYRWLVNGSVVPTATTSVIPSEFLKRGDYVSAEVTVSDGTAESDVYLTKPVVVVNTRPIVNRVTLELDRSAAQALVKARVESIDPDSDEVQYFYRWWHNNKMVKEGSEGVLSTVGFARKDTLSVEVLPRDEEGEGVSGRSDPVTVANALPEIVSKPVWVSQPNVFEYKVEGNDPDGDALVYTLEVAPPGMTIDKVSGQITWSIGSNMSGSHRVKVMVNDGQGGNSWQEFEIVIPASGQPISIAPLHG